MKNYLAILFLLIAGTVMGQQTIESMMAEARKYEFAFKEKEALEKYKEVLLKNANEQEALTSASYLYSKVGERSTEKTLRLDYFNKAAALAQKAIKQNNKDPEAHYAYAVALGRLSLMASSEEKLKNAKLIQTEAEKTLSLDAKHAGANYILGRLNSEISNMSTLKVMAAKALFGGIPEGCTFEKATSYFNKAMEYKPNYILYYLDAAQNFVYMGKKAEAKLLLIKAIELPMSTPDDPYRVQDCKRLLEKL